MISIILLSVFMLTEAFHTPPEFFDEPSKNWVVLVAGSNGWSNYRHQSDIFHAYQILKKRGIPESNIITMAYNDIANNRFNPFHGKVFNDYLHKDNYAGVVIDYEGEDVNPDTFVRVLKGDKTLKADGKKVLESGPEDNVFIFFSDHGAEGLIAFPSGDLMASTLNETLTDMYERNQYNKMVIYIEACYSGSMFEEILSTNIRVYATTAANSRQSSYAAFCEDRLVRTCLADEYSYNWMVDTEKMNIHQRSLETQYDEVKMVTKRSEVKVYGDLSMGALMVSEFQGHGQEDLPAVNTNKKVEHVKPAHRSHLLPTLRQLMDAKTEDEHQFFERKLHRAIDLGQMAKSTMDEVVMDVKKSLEPTTQQHTRWEQLKCFEAAFNVFKINCFTIQQVPEVAGLVKHLHELCRSGYQAAGIIASIHHVCI